MASERTRWFHGGVPNLRPGDVLLPPSETNKPTLQQYAARLPNSGHVRADRVFLTSDPDVAALFASVYPFGTVYEVDAEGVEPDPDCADPDLSVQCARATVVRVVRRRVDPATMFRGMR